MQIFCSAFDVNLDKRAWISILIIPMAITMVIMKELDTIAPFSAAANVLLMYSIGVVIYAGITTMV